MIKVESQAKNKDIRWKKNCIKYYDIHPWNFSSDCEDCDNSASAVIKNIQKCMDNFKAGEKSVLKEIGAVVSFLQTQLQTKVLKIFFCCSDQSYLGLMIF